MYLIVILLYSHLILKTCNQNLGDAVHEANCQGFDTCDSCIENENYCNWCYQTTFKGDRCGPVSSLTKRGCSQSNIFLNNEKSEIHQIISDKTFNDVTNPDNVEESVQIKPQRIKIKLRPKQPLTIDFKYRLAKNYPLDLYYLMDLTYTMQQDLRTMATLGKELTELLQKLTKHFRVGFGYYSDKVAMPFAKMTETFLENPCSNSAEVCEKGFDFIHVLNFTNNVNKFIDQINKSKTTSNLDNLEGGLDALYQIIICGEQIQWRPNSRKIIVVATDGTLHVAGDGILSGAVKRNLNKCLLDSSGVYTGSLIYDYPSVEELYHRLLEHKMNVLFAAKEDAINYYKNLNKVIPSVTYVGLLAEKSTNVLNLVKEGYFNVVKTVQFSAQASQNLKITFKSNCKKTGDDWIVGKSCDNIEEGKEYSFRVELEIGQLPKGLQTETIIIEEKNIEEKLVIEVEYVGICRCKNDSPNIVSKSCSSHGLYTCGVCECKDGWKGNDCEIQCEAVLYEECRQKNSTYTSSTCYGRGDCQCGKCICDDDYTGKYCNERQCPRGRNGELCSGYLHGICENGICKCTDLYTDPDCSCLKSQTNCKAPGSDEICSGFGYCRCGKCICNPSYSGDFCEICSTCTGLCSTYEDCVIDTLFNSKDLSKCTKVDGAIFRTHLTNSSMSATDANTCYFRHEENDGKVCEVLYKYDVKKTLVDLHIYKECKEPIKAGVVIGIIIGAIIAVGFLGIVLWKAKIVNEDRKEYARFMKRLSSTRTMDTNPLYNSPIRMYEMPMELQNIQQKHESL